MTCQLKSTKNLTSFDIAIVQRIMKKPATFDYGHVKTATISVSVVLRTLIDHGHFS